jgi:hypothetical protein
MAAMGLAIARRSWKKQVSTPTLCSPLSQPEFRGFFLGSDQLGSVWQLELKNRFRSRVRMCTKLGQRLHMVIGKKKGIDKVGKPGALVRINKRIKRKKSY